MNRKVLAIAVGVALATAGVAQADVTISGLAHMSFDNIDDGDKSVGYVSSNSSKLTFKGSEDLGVGGIKANWMFDTSVVMDGAGTSVFDRETYVGLSSSFGSLNIGKQDTPMKKLARKADFFGDQVGDSRAILNEGTQTKKSDGFYWDDAGGLYVNSVNAVNTAAMAADGDFNDSISVEHFINAATAASATLNADSTRTTTVYRETATFRAVGLDARPGNALVVTSPDMGGITASLLYVPTDGVPNSSLLGIGAVYSSGPLFVGFAYESHGKGANPTPTVPGVTRDVRNPAGTTGDVDNVADADTAAASKEESAMRVAVSYTMGDAKVAGLIQTVTNARGADGMDRMTYGIGGSYKLGSGTFKAQFYMADEYDDAKDTGGSLIAIGYDQTLSKSTTVYVAYAMSQNDKYGNVGVTGAWHPTANYLVLDKNLETEDQTAMSLGIKHSF